MNGAIITPRTLVLDAESRFRDAGLVFGHGTGDARAEAVFLVFHVLGTPFDATDAELDAPLSAAQIARVEALIRRRIETRSPSAYLTGHMWFAGHEFTVDERVLIPRSPIAELIENRFEPWIAPGRIRRVLDIGTGSGCIAAAVALRFPEAIVEATDISADALQVAQCNVRRHRLEGRVSLIRADLYPPTTGLYDVIISNPPYVPRADLADLPDEYHREPQLALDGGDDGLDHVRRIVVGAGRRLAPDGLLVLDVGTMAAALEAAFPRLPFTWVELARGGEGVCVLLGEQLAGPPVGRSSFSAAC